MNARGKKRVYIKIALHLQALSLVREKARPKDRDRRGNFQHSTFSSQKLIEIH